MSPRGASPRGLALVGAALVGFLAGRALPDAWAADAYGALDTYARVLGQIERSALGSPDARALVYASLRGMAGSVDAHSAFWDPEAWAAEQAAAAGSFAGVGAVFEGEACGQRVVRVLPGGPGARAGLGPGDCVEAVGERRLAGLGAAEAAEALRGVEGEARVLTVARGAERLRLPVVLTRTPEAAVEATTGPDGVAVAHVIRFDPGAAAQLARAVGAAPRLVLDLRGNPGGRLEEAVAMADLFLSEGVVVRTAGRGPGSTREFTARPSPDDLPASLVVLVGPETASAAEIVAGALQAAGRARLVGRPTRGKGTVQSLFRYEDGSALRLTDATWSLADGRSPSPAAPLVPDHPVPPGGDDLAAARALFD